VLSKLAEGSSKVSQLRQMISMDAEGFLIMPPRDSRTTGIPPLPGMSLALRLTGSIRRRSMVKNGLIVPVCFIILSGCSIFDNSETTPQAPTADPVADSEPAPAITEVQPATVKQVPSAPTRSLSAGDIRRLQTRLRELGFDPGPVDGVAGSRTKVAFARLETGCSRLEPLSENLPASLVEKFGNNPSGDKAPSHADTVILQSQLRSAGFDPGPVDGILGVRTKSLVSILHSSCSMAKEFQGALDQRAAILEPGRTPAVRLTKPAQTSDESAKRNVATSKSDDEVRILQLRLRDAGFDPGPFDGVMGSKTKAALEQYEATQRNRKTKASVSTKKISAY
jgi:peptidoglycan hydrolase-like protein with peptidoglycan-binding domain